MEYYRGVLLVGRGALWPFLPEISLGSGENPVFLLGEGGRGVVRLGSGICVLWSQRSQPCWIPQPQLLPSGYGLSALLLTLPRKLCSLLPGTHGPSRGPVVIILR